MPPNLKWIGIYGNGALAAGAGLIAFGSIINREVIPILIGLAVCALSVYNIRVIRWATSLDPEEEYLETEVRKADLRQHLAELGDFAHPPDAAPSADAGENRSAPTSPTR